MTRVVIINMIGNKRANKKGDKTMLDTLIQLNVLGFTAVIGYMTGDALVKMVKGSVEAGNRILPLVGNLLASLLLPVEEPTVEPTVEPTEELDQQITDDDFELKSSECANATVVKPVSAKALKRVADFAKIEGLMIEKVKSGYLLTVDEFKGEHFRTLKDASKFIEQLMSEGLSLWSRV